MSRQQKEARHDEYLCTEQKLASLHCRMPVFTFRHLNEERHTWHSAAELRQSRRQREKSITCIKIDDSIVKLNLHKYVFSSEKNGKLNNEIRKTYSSKQFFALMKYFRHFSGEFQLQIHSKLWSVCNLFSTLRIY